MTAKKEAGRSFHRDSSIVEQEQELHASTRIRRNAPSI